MPDELKQKDDWVSQNLLAEKGGLPFSFTYDGKPSAELLPAWERKASKTKLDANRTEHVLIWTDAKTGLEVRCGAVEYNDFPVVEWTLYFKNTGAKDTPIIENIQGLNVKFQRKLGEEFILHHQNGDNCTPVGYAPHQTKLVADSRQVLAPAGGRPTDTGFPYFNIEYDGGGVIAVLGWPGRWAAGFTRDTNATLNITGGQELTRLRLLPGEEVRSPLNVLLFWKGDWIRSQNLWRRWMIAHNLPRPGGKPPEPFDSICMGVHQYEAGEIQAIDTYLKGGVKHDYWWMDAGWYPCNSWPEGRGTWEPDPVRFPKGIKAVSDYVHSKGMKLVLWFEPETVDNGSWVAKNHPDWVLGGRLLNLGNPAARQWLTDHVIRFISEQGVDLYRQDFNQDPLDCWRRNDAPDRQGMTENLHVQGYLAFWDALRRKYPDMLIDSCSSGGRRNDLETLRRAVPLLRSDYQAPQAIYMPGMKVDEVAVGNQGHGYGIALWIPYYGTGEYYNDGYSFRSHMCPAMGVGYDPGKPIDWEALRRTISIWRLAAPNYYGDYYPLTDYSLAEESWMAWQYHRSAASQGLVQVFRRRRCKEETMFFKLHGIDAKRAYEVTDLDREKTMKLSGRELAEKGLPVKLEPRQAAVLCYKPLQVLSSIVTADVLEGETPLPVALDGKDSFAPKGTIVKYAWDFGDGATAEGPGQKHVYAKPGTYAATLTVQDNQGATDKVAVTITVRPADVIPPTIAAVAVPKPEKVLVTFSKPVEQAGAETASNYALNQGSKVLSAALETDGLTVALTTSPLAPNSVFTLTVNNVKDRARKPNVIAANSQAAVQYTALLARWKLDEGKGDMARDSSGNGYDGILKNSPAWVAGRKDGALSFNGRDNFVEMATHVPELAVPFSITFWVNPAETQVEYADILGNHRDAFGVVMQQDGKKTNLFGFGYGDGKTGYGPGAVQLAANTWQHVAVICDGEDAVCYVNGVEKSRSPAKGTLTPNPDQNFRLGQGYHTGRYFNGQLSDVRIYVRAFSTAEVQELYKAE